MPLKTRAQVLSERILSLPAVMVFHFEDDGRLKGAAAEVDAYTGGGVAVFLRRKEFLGKKGEVKTFPYLRGRRVTRISLVGLGKRAEFDGIGLRAGVARAASEIAAVGLRRIGVALPGVPTEKMASPRLVQTIVESAQWGAYRFTEMRAELPEPGWAFPTEVTVFMDGKPSDEARQALEWGAVLGEATNYARNLDNLPGNVITPAELAERACRLAAECGITVRVLDVDALQQEGFGGILAVGRGSQNPPRLILLEHEGEGPPVAFLGKGLTFDSGGISLKPSANMEEMKFDKSGGIAVLGAMRAVAALGIPRRVVGVIAAAENLPSGSATRPGDIITMYSGKTVEVANTDAEGRLVLADALAYVEQTYKPTVMIDFATLTGACVVALGNQAAGLFTKNDDLAGRVAAAGAVSGDRVWRLPLWPEYGEQMKSHYADLKNVGGREAGAITGAWFLSQFVQEAPWAHVDIAGTAWAEPKRPLYTAGATGFGVRLCLEFLRTSPS